ncbi:MAG: nucleoside monophosphate kinase [Candidatus Moraniibacteriota bacterium]|nr:MAG: nucleoside monophosphate kinase [Candidatus Moranbacteria bacterium]
MPLKDTYILLGSAGSGKSTQAELLKSSLHLAHIDIGAELRAVAAHDTELGRQVNEFINVKHELAPDDTVFAVLVDAVHSVPETVGLLIDGIPRGESQIDEVLKVLEESGRTLNKVIFIDVPEAVSVERISKRYACEGCKRTYILGKNLIDSTKPCRYCGGHIAQRVDDTEDGVRKRHQIFHQKTLPVIRYFESTGQLLHVDGNQETYRVFKFILEHVRPD